MVNFNDIADKPMADIERPPLLPVGTYRAMVDKPVIFDTISDGRFETVDFPMKVLAASEDVDEDGLAEFGDVTNARLRHRFMFSTEDEANAKRSAYNIKRFITEHLQIDGAEGMSLREALGNVVGAQCMISVGWRPDKNNPEIQYPEIRRTAPVE